MRFAAATFMLIFGVLSDVRAVPLTVQDLRPYQVNDAFKLEGLGYFYGGPVSLSPDGYALAFTRLRPGETLRNYLTDLEGNERGDIWVQERRESPAFALTDGAGIGAGYFAPEWSPDGARLAFLSASSDSVTLWLWDRPARTVRQLTKRSVEYVPLHFRPYQWIDATHLICAVLSVGEKPEGLRVILGSADKAQEGWRKAVRGTESTASVLRSGLADLNVRPQGELLLIDVQTGNSTALDGGLPRAIRLSPDRKTVAYARQISSFVPRANERLPIARGRFTLELRRLEGSNPAQGVTFPDDVVPETVSWSPDGKQVAFIAYPKSRNDAPEIYRYELSSKKLVALLPMGLDVTPVIRNAQPPRLRWVANEKLLVHGIRRAAGEPRMSGARSDWWLLTSSAAPLCISCTFKNPPEDLWPEAEHRSFIGVADGEIWRWTSDRPEPQPLTLGSLGPIAQIVWPRSTNYGDHEYHSDPNATFSEVIFSVPAGEGFAYHLMRLRGRETYQIKSPSVQTSVVAYRPASGMVILTENSEKGVYLWRLQQPSSDAELVMRANDFLRSIMAPQFRSLSYRSLDGSELTAWLMLPAGYERGRRYPVITRVYPGRIHPPEIAGRLRFINGLNSSSFINPNVATAHGYIWLMPSMPLNARGDPDDPLLKLTNGVLPAVEEAVRSGYADPERVFVLGQSLGGYATYGLVSQTNRFKAAISMAGPSNLLSFYSTFRGDGRYGDYSHEDLFLMQQVESIGGVLRMGAPPWKDLGRFLRNSPIFQVDRVQTPVMIIQGDLDYVPIQQGEEFFSSLYRMGKPAEFVRYWGDWHVLKSPANIRDMWSRILAWFDEFGDISRDENGGLIFEADRVKSRAGSPALKPEDYLKFDALGAGGEEGTRRWLGRKRAGAFPIAD